MNPALNDPDPSSLEPRQEYVAMALASFARIVETAEEIVLDRDPHDEDGTEAAPIDVHDEVGWLVYALWHRLAEADGLVEAREQEALERVLAGDPDYAAAVARLSPGPPAPRPSRLMSLARARPTARRHLAIELETFGYALASVDRTFDHAELDALRAFLAEIER